MISIFECEWEKVYGRNIWRRGNDKITLIEDYTKDGLHPNRYIVEVYFFDDELIEKEFEERKDAINFISKVMKAGLK